jgi:hypothetical protein
MLILDDNNETIILDSIHVPVMTDFIWVLDLILMDYTLTPLLVLEATTSPSIKLKIQNFEFILPANWNILVTDKETTQLDVVEISELAGKEFTALTYGPDCATIEMSPIALIDYFPNKQNVGPALNKHQMLCHPISADLWVNISPSDSYNKYLKNHTIGDIL